MHNSVPVAEKTHKIDWNRQTVNFAPEFAERAEARWRKLGLASWTEYVKALIESDLAERPLLIRSEEGAVFATVIRKLDVASTGQYSDQIADPIKTASASASKLRNHPVRPKISSESSTK